MTQKILKYRPSSGTEGEWFFSRWCRRCERDRHEDDRCEIIGMTMAHDVDEPEYPVEWQYGADETPCCTAFVPEGQPAPPDRCPHTVDMFEQGGSA